MSADCRSAWSLAVLSVLAALTVGACHERAPSYTAVYLAIDADPYVRERAASFLVKTARDELVLKAGDRPLPLFVTVEPGAGESRISGEISVAALDGAGAIIVRREAVLTLLDGKQRRVEVLLTRFCAESYEACEAAGRSCDGCACTERKIAAADLSVVDAAAPLAGVTAPSVCAEGWRWMLPSIQCSLPLSTHPRRVGSTPVSMHLRRECELVSRGRVHSRLQ